LYAFVILPMLDKFVINTEIPFTPLLCVSIYQCFQNVLCNFQSSLLTLSCQLQSGCLQFFPFVLCIPPLVISPFSWPRHSYPVSSPHVLYRCSMLAVNSPQRAGWPTWQGVVILMRTADTWCRGFIVFITLFKLRASGTIPKSSLIDWFVDTLPASGLTTWS
jgi:hypothetical protein